MRVGFNGRLDSLQCAVVAEKLGIFEDELERRREIAAIYDGRLANHVDHQAFGPAARAAMASTPWRWTGATRCRRR